MSAPCGVSLAFFDFFIDLHGGKQAFINLTTSEVNLKFLMPQTASTKLSLVEQYQQETASDITLKYIKPAKYFVSHAWKYLFLDVIESLQLFFASKPAEDAIVWFDLFTNSQHDTSIKEFSWWTSTFCNSIAAMKNVVMVLLPWDRPIPLTRAWCVFEVFATVTTHSEFHVAMTQRETDRFAENVTIDTFYKMLGNVKSEACESFKPEDKALIAAAIKQCIGFVNMDNMVFRVFEQWMTDTLMKKISNSSGALKAIWLFKLASLSKAQGKYDQAQSLYQSCIDLRTEIHGQEHLDTIQAMAHLGSLNKDQGKYTAAESVLLHCLQLLETLHESQSNLALDVADDMAATLQCLGKFDQAEAMYHKCISTRSLTKNDARRRILESNLASLYQEQGKYALAKPIFEQCLKESIESVGMDNPSTLALKNNLAATLNYLHEYAAAEALYLQCLGDSERILGPDHPSTLAKMNNLAANYFYQHKYSQAEELYAKCFDLSKRVLGRDHPTTLLTMNNLANLLKDAQKVSEAEALFKECIEISTRVLGEDHPNTLMALNNLALLYERQEKLDEALERLGKCLELRRKVLAIDHPHLSQTMYNVAMLYVKKRDIAHAEVLLLEFIDLQVKLHGEQHSQTIMGKLTLAEAYMNAEKWDAAEPLLLACVNSTLAVYGHDTAETIRITQTIEFYYSRRISKSLQLKEWVNVAKYIEELEKLCDQLQLSENLLKEINKIKERMPVGSPRNVVATLSAQGH